MNFLCIGFGIAFIVAGVLFAFRKLLPRAWREAPDEEKERVNIKRLCINVGAMVALCGVIVLLRGLWAAFEGKAFIITMVGWLILCGLDVLFISKSDRYNDGR